MFDLCALRKAVAREGRVARIVVAAVEGSAPREVGASMLVWADGVAGTIGGGALEWQAMARARLMLCDVEVRCEGPGSGPGLRSEGLRTGGLRLDREALGPGLGQCCGGAVTLLTEVYGAAEVAALEGQAVIARPVGSFAKLPVMAVAEARLQGVAPAARETRAGITHGAAPVTLMPLAVARLLDRARGRGEVPAPVLLQGWMVEPVARPQRLVWIWGAGHVGRAIAAVLAPLPGVAVTLVDVAADRFPAALPDGVTPLWAAEPEALVAHAPREAEHLVLTFSHALDLELCHRLLGHGFRSLGLIGSASKRARFRSRLAALGHGRDEIRGIRCPIGDPSLGKHPQAIALGLGVEFLKQGTGAAQGAKTA